MGNEPVLISELPKSDLLHAEAEAAPEDKGLISWIIELKSYIDDADIKRPGKWLESDISAIEEKECFAFAAAQQKAIKSRLSNKDRFNAIKPYFNSFMHLLYKSLQNGAKLDVATDENGVLIDGIRVDFVCIVTSFAMESMAFIDHEGKIKTALLDSSTSLLSSPFLPLYTGLATNEFRKISKGDFVEDKLTHTATLTTPKGVRVTVKNYDKIQGSLGSSAKKLLDTAILYLTFNNVHNSSTIRPTVEIPLIEYGEKKGYNFTPLIMETEAEQVAENKRVEERLKEFKKKVRADLSDIKQVEMSFEESKGRNKGDYSDISIISSHSIRTIKGVPMIRINFDVDMANYLVKSYVMQYPVALLKLDDRNANAYALGCYIANHNSIDNNAAAGTQNTLSVKCLLEAAPEIISIEALREKGRRDWKRLIKKRLEASIESLMEIGYIKRWEYRNSATGQRFTAENSNSLSWDSFNGMMVDFVLMENPAQIERQKRKAEQKAIAATSAPPTPPKKRGRPPKAKK